MMDWPESRDFGALPKEVTCAEAPRHEKQHAVFTDGSCRVVGNHQKWKETAAWSLAQQVAEATEGQGGSSQSAELKAIPLALGLAV